MQLNQNFIMGVVKVKQMENDVKKTELFECACYLPNHMFYVSKYDDEDEFNATASVVSAPETTPDIVTLLLVEYI